MIRLRCAYGTWVKRTNLFIVLALAATRLHEDEAFRTFNLVIVECTSLAVLDSKLVSSPVNKFEGRQNFRELPLDFTEQRQDILVFG